MHGVPSCGVAWLSYNEQAVSLGDLLVGGIVLAPKDVQHDGAVASLEVHSPMLMLCEPDHPFACPSAHTH